MRLGRSVSRRGAVARYERDFWLTWRRLVRDFSFRVRRATGADARTAARHKQQPFQPGVVVVDGDYDRLAEVVPGLPPVTR
jgi:hypothetical protein